MSHPAVPPAVSRPWIAVAALVWVMASVFGGVPRPEPLPAGKVEFDAVLATDTVHGRYGDYALAEAVGTVVLLDLDGQRADVAAGERVRVFGVADGRVAQARGQWHSSAVTVRELTRLAPPSAAYLAVGNAVRDRVIESLAPMDDGRALLAGFLIGDTESLDPADEEAMRLAGLSHFVAVSGSNVALFLGLMFLATGPLSMGPRRRALIGLLALPVYAAATRFEPSVMRASVMAAIALSGKLFGIALETWQLLSLAVVAVLAFDPGLVDSVGFQLSVAATAGVLVGARWQLRGGKLARALAVTIGAQIAVAPLLLYHFGSVPVFSPLANLIAAPLVSSATITAAVGVAGVDWAVPPAALLAQIVLALARGASVWPQADALLAAGLAVVGLLVWRFKWSRLPVGVAASVLVVSVALGGSATLPQVGVVVFDVGQGDAILLHGGNGHFALVDGGPDPVALVGKLRAYGVPQLELVVATHVHADHVDGLVPVMGQWAVGELWAAFSPHETEGSLELISSAQGVGVPVRAPPVGEVRRIGSLTIEVLGPRRRYKSANDQSIVLLVRGPGRTMLLTGDVEVIAQHDLAGLTADVLKVPHHGGGTSDERWLVAVGARLAVIPVGANDFGHPVPWVIEALEASNAVVVRTDQSGDVAVDLDVRPDMTSEPTPSPSLRSGTPP